MNAKTIKAHFTAKGCNVHFRAGCVYAKTINPVDYLPLEDCKRMIKIVYGVDKENGSYGAITRVVMPATPEQWKKFLEN